MAQFRTDDSHQFSAAKNIPLPPPTVNKLVHNVIKSHAVARPSAQAIASASINLTYQDLDEASSWLASRITSLGIGFNSILPIICEKSAITIISMVAILKAGCAFTALDVSHPTKRLLEIVEDVKAPVLLLSTEQIPRFKNLTGFRIIALSNNMLSELNTADASYTTPVNASPSDLMYTIFTSGSTGRPKGVMIEHRAWLTAALAYGKDQELNFSSRVLQFASYAFDMSLMEIFTTLIFGGCVCVPTEDDRFNRIEKFVNEIGLNTLMLTPSYAKLLDPTTMPAVRMLVTGGEAVPSHLIELWSPHVKIYVAYGPTEASIQSSGARLNIGTAAVPSGLLGHPTGCNLWIVREDNHNELVLEGQTGELVIEGNTLARGYLGDDKKTAAAFVDMSIGSDIRRVFKTGDLVRQTDSGDIIFVGRKDTQAKVHGQRLELTEIEARLAPALTTGLKCCIEKVQSLHFTDGGAIVAFLGKIMQISGNISPEIRWTQVETMLEMSVSMQAHLETVLPKSMMPSLYVPITFIPLTTSHKTNRSMLRDLIQTLTSDELLKLRKVDNSAAKYRDLSAGELALRELWATVLNVEPKTIGPDDNFIQLGGDSVTSMKLIAVARNRGITLTSATILSNPVLYVQARLAITSGKGKSEQDIEPFGLLGSRSMDLQETAAALCKLPIDEIEDILPMTISQMRWYGKTLVKPTAWIDQYHFQLPSSINLDRFMVALNSVVQATDLLRARIITTSNRELFQAITKFHPVKMINSSNTLEAYLSQDVLIPMGVGTLLSRYAIVHLANSKKIFVWTIHHAIYDGYSLPMLLQAIRDFYYGLEVVPFTPFKRYLRGIAEKDLFEAESFWKKYLLDAAWTKFPALSHEKSPPMGRILTTFKIASRQVPPLNAEVSRFITIANIIRVAYGATLSQFSTDRLSSVLFLESLSGRNSSLPGIDRIAGPTLLTIPTKLDLPPKKPCCEILLEAQISLTNRMKFESFPLHRLLPLAPPLELRSVLLIENETFLINEAGCDLFGCGKEEVKLEETEGLPMIFRCAALQNEIHIDVRHDNSVIGSSEMEAFLKTFKALVERLWQGDGSQPLEAILLSV
ncbi:acetyl-CoA synthetase-like protein [Trichoderma evansii]